MRKVTEVSREVGHIRKRHAEDTSGLPHTVPPGAYHDRSCPPFPPPPHASSNTSEQLAQDTAFTLARRRIARSPEVLFRHPGLSACHTASIQCPIRRCTSCSVRHSDGGFAKYISRNLDSVLPERKKDIEHCNRAHCLEYIPIGFSLVPSVDSILNAACPQERGAGRTAVHTIFFIFSALHSAQFRNGLRYKTTKLVRF